MKIALTIFCVGLTVVTFAVLIKIFPSPVIEEGYAIHMHIEDMELEAGDRLVFHVNLDTGDQTLTVRRREETK